MMVALQNNVNMNIQLSEPIKNKSKCTNPKS